MRPLRSAMANVEYGRAIASNIVVYRTVWISTQRLRGSENGKNLFFCYGNTYGERDRERQET